jgi:glycosyltransferase involved in cell wall biosynthesis
MKPKIRLALLADAAHVNVQRWCEGLSHAGAEIHLLSFRSGGEHLQQNMGDCTRLPIPTLPQKLHYFAAVPHVRHLIRKIKPDVVVAYYVTGYGTLGSLVQYHPLVQVTAGSDVLIAPQSRLMNRLVRYNFRQADMVTAWAPHLAQAAQRLGAAADNIVVLPRGIPFRQFASERCRVPKKSDTAQIISTRSLKSDYHPDLLIEAVRLLRDEGMDLTLTLAGEGPQKEELKALTKRLELENQVQFPGFVSNNRLPLELAKHNLYISLIDSDGVSASLLEAMAVGLLPIVANHEANRYWIEQGKNGVLLDELTPAAIARDIRKAFSDVALRQRAWDQNSNRVGQSADLYRNSEIFVEHFRKLTRDYRGSTNGH